MKSFFNIFVVSIMVLGTGCSQADYRGPDIGGQDSSQLDGGDNSCPFGIGMDGFCLPPGGDDFPGGDGGSGDDDDGAPLPPTVTSLTGAKAVASGERHTCVLMKTGTVKCFGDNTYGQLGNASAANPSPVAVDVTGLTGVSAIVAGAYHTCALVSGSVRCWGRNNKGQLGNNDYADSSVPVQVHDLSDVAQIAAGAEHTCAIKGGVTRYGYCWGDNTYGQLATGDTVSQAKPMEARKARTAAGTLFKNDEVSAGARHTCFRSENRVYCAGDNAYGQLGNNANGVKSYPLLEVGGGLGEYGKRVTSISLGAEHSCAMVEDEEIYCWGRNHKKQLAGATTSASTVNPAKLFGRMDLVTSVRAGGNAVCAVFDDTLECWGESVSSSSGSSTLTYPNLGVIVLYPALPNNPLDPVALYSVASVSAPTMTSSATPAPVSGLGSPLKDYSLGASHGCAVIGEAVRCWGSNSHYQLGNAGAGAASASAVPAQRNI